MTRGSRWLLLVFACAAAFALAWFAIARLGDNWSRAGARNAGIERARAADRSCLAEMRLRDPAADADADVRRGIVQPIILSIGDDTRFEDAPGLASCASRDLARVQRDFPPGTICEPNLAGPHRAIMDYSLAYNRRLLALAPRQVAAACGWASR